MVDPPLLDLLLKEYGPLWLLGLFPLLFVMIGRGAWYLHRKAENPKDLARFAGFPERLTAHPRRCRMCSLVLFTGICVVSVALLGIPVWAVLRNELANVRVIPNLRTAESALWPLEVSLMAAGYGGAFLIFSTYLVAFLTRTEPAINQYLETEIPLAESHPEGDDKGEKEQSQVN